MTDEAHVPLLQKGPLVTSLHYERYLLYMNEHHPHVAKFRDEKIEVFPEDTKQEQGALFLWARQQLDGTQYLLQYVPLQFISWPIDGERQDDD